MVENLKVGYIQNKVEKLYNKYNDWIGWKKYSEELRLWCQEVINDIDNKVKKWFQSVKNIPKLNKIHAKDTLIFSKKSNDIRNSIQACCNSWTYVKRSHKDRLLNLGWWIDNYENEVVKIVNDLIDQKNEMQWVIKKENETWKEYFNLINGVYVLTENTNLPKIHEVFGGLVKPWEKWMIDYSECKNPAIKNKMLSTMWGNRCYLHCDKQKGTYFVSSNEIEETEEGTRMRWISTQRALIREWVKIVPNSKITKDAKAEIEVAARKEANRNLTDGEKNSLMKIVPQKLSEQLPGYRNEFFNNTEKDLKTKILKAKSAGYEYTWPICSKKWYTKNGSILEIHLIHWSTKVEWPLLTTKYSDGLFKILDKHEWDLVSYMTVRIKQLRDKLDYATKHEYVWKWIETVTNEDLKNNEIMKKNALDWLWLLQTLIDNLIDSEWNSFFDDDDAILSDCKKYVGNAIYSIENTRIITKAKLDRIHKELTTKLWPFYQAKWLNHWWRSLTFSEKWIWDQLKKVIFGWKNSAIQWIRRLWEWTTVFDNNLTTYLRDEIIENANTDKMSLSTENNNWANECFQSIKNYFFWQDDFNDESKCEAKKWEIDALYNAADSNYSLIEFMINKSLLPRHATLEDKSLKENIDTIRKTLKNKEAQIKNMLNSIDVNSVREWLKKKKLELESSDNLSEEDVKRLNYYDCLLEMPDEHFTGMVEDEKQQMKILKYQWVDDILRLSLTPRLAKKAWWIQWINNANIYNDSIGAWWMFERSDENCAKIWPIITEIIEEVLVAAISIALAPTGAWEAIYASFRFAKAAASTLKWIQKMMKFMTSFAKALAKKMARQYAWKFVVRSAKAGKATARASRMAMGIEKWARWMDKIRQAYQTIKATETFGSIVWKLAMKWTSMVIEWTTFHISSTVIHNAINGVNLSEGLDPFGYTEWPDGEKIPNRRNYAQSIAFLWVLKTLGKPIQSVTGKMAEGFLKGKYPISACEKILSNSLSLTWEMASMMWTDQILSLTFDWKFKEVTGEDLITMFWMVAWLRLTNKVNAKIQEYDRKSVTFEMKQWDNTFNVKIDREWNVLKVEWTDGNWRDITHPEKVLGIRSKVEWDNLRSTRAGQEVWTVEWTIRELWNLHEWDMITVKHGDKNVRFKKNKEWNWEIEDAWGIESDRFKSWEEYVVKKNSDGSWYHLETKVWLWPKISLDWRVNVRLKGRWFSWMWDRETSTDVLEEERNIREEKLYEEFDKGIMSENGITIDGMTYKLERKPYEWQNLQHKWRVVYTETWPDWVVKYRVEANSDTFSLPDNSSGNKIRDRFNSTRKKYIDQNLDATIISNRQEVVGDFSEINGSRTVAFEQKSGKQETVKSEETVAEPVAKPVADTEQTVVEIVAKEGQGQRVPEKTKIIKPKREIDILGAADRVVNDLNDNIGDIYDLVSERRDQKNKETNNAEDIIIDADGNILESIYNQKTGDLEPINSDTQGSSQEREPQYTSDQYDPYFNDLYNDLYNDWLWDSGVNVYGNDPMN